MFFTLICVMSIVAFFSIATKNIKNNNRSYTPKTIYSKKNITQLQNLPYRSRCVMNKYERPFYLKLKEFFPNYHVFPQVSLSSIIFYSPQHLNAKNNRFWNNQINQMSVDYLITDQEFKTLAVIELDGYHHDLPANKKRDEKKDKALNNAGISIIRVRANTNPTKEILIKQAPKLFEEKEAQTMDKIGLVVETIAPIFKQLHDRYKENTYPAAPYQHFKNVFSQGIATNNDILEALLWKYGKYNQYKNHGNYPKQKYDTIIYEIQKAWNEFITTEFNHTTPQRTFNWWKNKLDKTNTDRRFITIAYLTHLIHHQTIPIIDQHNFRAMNLLLNQTEDPIHIISKKPTCWNDILILNRFMELLLKQIPHIDKSQLDRFLMKYGEEKKRQLTKFDAN